MGVVYDVFADLVQFGFVADDVFVIIALPDAGFGGVAEAIDFGGDRGFKPAYDRTHVV